jgi:hypothetical protein
MAPETNNTPAETVGKISGPVLGAGITDFFADGMAGVAIHAGTVRINFYAMMFDPATNNMVRLVTSRLVLPLNEFEGFRRALDGVSARLQEAVKSAAAGAAPTTTTT